MNDTLSPRERRLPLWAQQTIEGLRRTAISQIKEMNRLRQAHSILTEQKGWHTVPYRPPDVDTPADRWMLFSLYTNGAHPVCSLGPGDVLLVGRKNEEEKDGEG